MNSAVKQILSESFELKNLSSNGISFASHYGDLLKTNPAEIEKQFNRNLNILPPEEQEKAKTLFKKRMKDYVTEDIDMNKGDKVKYLAGRMLMEGIIENIDLDKKYFHVINEVNGLDYVSLNDITYYDNGHGFKPTGNKGYFKQHMKNNNIINESNLFEDDSDTVDQADPIMMFQDFADISGQFADIYATLTGYQTSYIQNPKVQQAIGILMKGVNQLMKQSTSTMQTLGQSFGLQENKKIKLKK